MEKWNKILWILTLFALTNCQYDPYAHKLTTREPETPDLIGEYLFDSQTVESSIKDFRGENGEWVKDILGAIDIEKKENLKHWGIHLIGMPVELRGAGLMNEKYPYNLIFTFGDPDLGEAMIFKKQ